jgi:hypothetical protein
MILYNKLIKIFLLLFSVLFIFFSCKNNKIEKNQNKKINNLIHAYPEFLREYKDNNIIWYDGTKMEYNDLIENKSFNELLNNPDLEEQMKMDYPKNDNNNPINIKNYDPGRIRFMPFFLKMYGSTREEVEKNLIKIQWMPKSTNKKISVTTINNVHLKLKEVSEELDKLPVHIKKYVINPAGTYSWRYIKGTKRLSMHSLGIAIDLNTNFSNYWLYDLKIKGHLEYKNAIPVEVVKIFENHGFIWGGKWYHYDTAHFEYRPELLLE